MARCRWTGREFEPRRAGTPQEQVFIDDHARMAAHTAARKYTMHLIATGALAWEDLRRWSDGGQIALAQPCTAARKVSKPDPDQLVFAIFG